jgi:transcriptional regulator with XRE-family HTH domain
MIQISDKRIARMDNEEYRHSFLEEMVKGWIVHQIRALRDHRGWTQQELGDRCKKPQSTIARLEDRDYGGCSVNTLLKLACAFDVALEIKFVNWPTFIDGTRDLSVNAMRVESWSRDQFQAKQPRKSTSTNNIVDITVLHKARGVDLDEGQCRQIGSLKMPSTRVRKFDFTNIAMPA